MDLEQSNLDRMSGVDEEIYYPDNRDYIITIQYRDKKTDTMIRVDGNRCLS